MKNLNVILYKVNRNLNRCYRTAAFFGVKNIFTYDCNYELKGNLFNSSNQVSISSISEMPKGQNVAYMETNGKINIEDVDWRYIDTICFGGETNDFTGKEFNNINKIKIKSFGKQKGLTVEAALAITLYKIREYEKIQNNI